MCKYRLLYSSISTTVSAMLFASNALAASFVANPYFNSPSGVGPTILTTDSNGGVARSAAKRWSAFNDTAGTTTTELLPSTLVPGGTMIHVTSTALLSGLYQVYPNPGPDQAYTCVWIYINHGVVGIGSGNQAATLIDAELHKTGSWELLNVGNQSIPASATVIYNTDPDGSDFYVESVSVSTNHNQCKPR